MNNLSIDLNTILTTLALGGISWMLKMLHANSTAAALSVQKQEMLDREMVELRARVVAAEAAIAEVSLRVAHIEGSNR